MKPEEIEFYYQLMGELPVITGVTEEEKLDIISDLVAYNTSKITISAREFQKETFTGSYALAIHDRICGYNSLYDLYTNLFKSRITTVFVVTIKRKIYERVVGK